VRSGVPPEDTWAWGSDLNNGERVVARAWRKSLLSSARQKPLLPRRNAWGWPDHQIRQYGDPLPQVIRAFWRDTVVFDLDKERS